MSWRRRLRPLDRARYVLAKHGAALRSRRGVVAVGVGPRLRKGQWRAAEICLQVFVERKPRPESSVPVRMRIPKSLDGVPIDVIESRFRAGAGCSIAGPDPIRRTRNGVLVGGIALARTTSNTYGTLGALLEDANSVYALTAGHVVEADAANVGQPFYASDWIGNVAALRRSTAANLDAALVRIEPTSGRFVASGMFNGPAQSLGVGSIWSSTGPVHVHGACSGHVLADVRSVPWSGTIHYQDGSNITLHDQAMVVPRNGSITEGDSGGAVLDSSQRRLLGMIVGGDTHAGLAIVTPIDSILGTAAFQPGGARLTPI